MVLEEKILLPEKKRLLLIMNPCAGLRRANRYLTNILSLFMKHGYESLVCITEKRGDAIAFARRHAGEVALVVAIGGDGTFNEVLTGLQLSEAATPVGYIPAGSTNDFATGLKLPKNILRAAENAVCGIPQTLDVGLFGTRYFSYVASFGAFTKVSYSTPQSAKNTVGHLAYILQSLRDLASLRRYHVRFELEDETLEEDYIFGAISNSTSVGGILSLDPKVVDMNDGQFELLLIKAPKNAMELNECIRALTVQDYSSHMLTFRSAPRVRVVASPDMDWTLDGEHEVGHESVEVRNIHNAFRLMLPQ